MVFAGMKLMSIILTIYESSVMKQENFGDFESHVKFLRYLGLICGAVSGSVVGVCSVVCVSGSRS